MSIGNCLTSVFAGFVIFSFLGYLADQEETTVDGVVDSGKYSSIHYAQGYPYVLTDLWPFPTLQTRSFTLNALTSIVGELNCSGYCLYSFKYPVAMNTVKNILKQ